MIRIGNSHGKGRGVFALRSITSGETIEEAPVVIVPEGEVGHLDATVLGDYYFLWGEDEKQAALLLGGGLCCLPATIHASPECPAGSCLHSGSDEHRVRQALRGISRG